MKFIQYSDEYRESAIHLLEDTFHGINYEKYFSWRFDKSDEFKPIMVCAVDNGKVVSFNSWIKWLFKYENKTFIGYQSGESATDDNYRRMGIWAKLVNLGENIAKELGYVDFFFGFPADISLGGFIKAGYSHVGTYSRKIRIINPFVFNKEKIREQNYITNADYIYTFQKDKITPLADSKYINWRFNENPKIYQLLKYSENNKYSIFIIRKRMYFNKKYKISIPEIQIMDCQFSNYDDSFVYRAIKYVNNIFSREAFWIRTFFNERSDKGLALNRYFHMSFDQRDAKLIFKKIKPEINEKLFLNFYNWDIQPHVIDSE